MSLWEMSFLGAVMIAVILLLRVFLINQLPKKTFLILWGVVMLRLLIPISISSVFSIYSLIPIVQENNNSNVSVINQNFAVNTEIEKVQESLVGEVWEGFAAQISVKWMIWFVGFLLCAGYFLFTYRKLYQEFQMSFPIENSAIKQWISQHNLYGKKRKIEIKQSDRITAALSYGILHPVILFPKNTDWEDFNKLQYVLEHEYIHMKRYDSISKLIMAAVVCIHWFNPMVWVMYVFFNRDLELACDEEVVRHFGNASKASYARTLISMEEQKSGFMPFCNNFNKNAMEERIRAIMKTKKITLAMLGLSVFVVVGVTGVFASSASKNEDVNKESMEVTAVEEGNGSGKTTAQYLKQFEGYGITYETIGSNLGNIYWNGELVGTFWDEKPDGSLFLTESELASDVAVCTSYDEHGNLLGVSRIVEEVPYESTTEISEMLSYEDENGETNEEIMQETSEMLCLTLDDGSMVNVGPCETKEELLEKLKSCCEEQVQLGKMTRQDADEIVERYETHLNKK